MAPLVQIIKYKLGEQWREMAVGLKGTLLAVVVAGVHLLLYTSPLGSVFESQMRTVWFGLRGPRPVPQSVTFVRLDSEALNAIKLPTDGMIPRKIFAEALSKLSAAGARMIMLDFFFLAEGADKESDQRLASALAATPSVIGRSFSPRVDSDPQGRKREVLAIEQPLKIFADNARAVVPLQVQLSDNQSVERINLPADMLYPGDTAVPLLRPLREMVAPGAKEPGEYDLINFYGEPSSITNLSLANLIDPHPLPDMAYFKDRVVFVGPAAHAAPGVPGKDSFKVPSSSAEMYGVEIHATVVANLLDGSWIRRTSPGTEIVLLDLLAVALTVTLIALPLKRAALALFAVVILWNVTAYVGFAQFFVCLPGATLFLLVMPVFMLLRWLAARRSHSDI